MQRLKNLMSALLGRTDRHDVSAVSLRRVSRLKKAALTFLVAASAAFLFCDQTNAAAPDDDINITNMGVYYPQRSRTVEGEWYTVYIETNLPYETVEWYVGGKLKETQTVAPHDLAGGEFSKVLNHRYVFTSGHTIEYYYDGRPHKFELRRKAGWYENGQQKFLNWPDEAKEPFFATPTFHGSATLPMDTPFTLTPGWEYHVVAYTNYGAGNPAAEALSDTAFYNPEAADPLPIPTGKEKESVNDNLPGVLK